jgi:spoIIIJ-associated protein
VKKIEVIGKTIDEAIENGLKELNVKKEMVEISILEQGSKGIFGLGAKPAKVSLTLKNTYETVARKFLGDVFSKMDIQCEIDIVEKSETLRVTLHGPQMGILIGYRGETLDALQYLLSLVINKENKDAEYKKVVLDTENYRQKREDTLVKLANRLAYKARRYNKSVILEPMNPYERRIIHSALQDHPDVKTHSEGDEPYRKVVIELKK